MTIPWSAIDHWQEIQQLIRAESAKYAIVLGTVVAQEGKQVRVRLQTDAIGGAAETYRLYSVVTPFLPSVGDVVALDRLSGGGLVVIGATQLISGDPIELPANAPIRVPNLIFNTGIGVYSGVGDPNGVLNVERGSLYIRDDPTNDPGDRIYVKNSQVGTAYGWVRLKWHWRRRTIREVITYAGASLSSSWVNKGFRDGPTVVAASAGNADTSTGNFLTLLGTSGTLNDVASMVGGANDVVRPEWDPIVSFGTRMPNTATSIRLWWGLFASTPALSSDPAINGAGFRFDTGASDVNYMCWSNDGTGGGTITDSGIPTAGNQANDLSMMVTGSDINFYIDGFWAARHTTNLPAAATGLPWGQYVTQLTTAQRAMRFGRLTIECEP